MSATDATLLTNGGRLIPQGYYSAGDAYKAILVDVNGNQIFVGNVTPADSVATPTDVVRTFSFLAAWNGGQNDRLRTSGVGDGVATGLLAAQMYGYNGATGDQWRNSVHGTLLASAVRTATTSSATQTNYNHRGVVISLVVTAASGTGGLQVLIEQITPTTAENIALNATPTAITGTGNKGYELGPGASGGATGDIQQRTAGQLPRGWRVRVVHGDASNYTYSVEYALIL